MGVRSSATNRKGFLGKFFFGPVSRTRNLPESSKPLEAGRSRILGQTEDHMATTTAAHSAAERRPTPRFGLSERELKEYSLARAILVSAENQEGCERRAERNCLELETPRRSRRPSRENGTAESSFRGIFLPARSCAKARTTSSSGSERDSIRRPRRPEPSSSAPCPATSSSFSTTGCG